MWGELMAINPNYSFAGHLKIAEFINRPGVRWTGRGCSRAQRRVAAWLDRPGGHFPCIRIGTGPSEQALDLVGKIKKNLKIDPAAFSEARLVAA
jgi:hypothetical protein